jgi:hypothetical protein
VLATHVVVAQQVGVVVFVLFIGRLEGTGVGGGVNSPGQGGRPVLL